MMMRRNNKEEYDLLFKSSCVYNIIIMMNNANFLDAILFYTPYQILLLHYTCVASST